MLLPAMRESDTKHLFLGLLCAKVITNICFAGVYAQGEISSFFIDTLLVLIYSII